MPVAPLHDSLKQVPLVIISCYDMAFAAVAWVNYAKPCSRQLLDDFIAMRSLTKSLLLPTAWIFFGAGGLLFWVGGRAISEFGHVERILAEFIGLTSAAACFVVGYFLKTAAENGDSPVGTIPTEGAVALVVTSRRPDGTPIRAICPVCNTRFSTEAFESDGNYPHERKLKEWYSEHFNAVHVEDKAPIPG